MNVQVHLSPSGVDTVDAFVKARCPDKLTADDKLSGYTISGSRSIKRCRVSKVARLLSLQRFTVKKIYDWRTATTIYSNNALCVLLIS